MLISGMLALHTLLELYSDLFATSKVKLVRHKDSRVEYRDLLKSRDSLLEYQKEQGRNVFKECDYIVSFVGKEQRRSIFIGVFKVGAVSFDGQKFHYELEEMPGFEDLVDRMVIDWGDATLAWHQWYSQRKEIVEILPKGYLGSFPGLLQFVLDFDELKRLIDNPEANADWRHHLSAVNGIYLILDHRSGQQYIGAAYGEEGIWGRWRDYARSLTGGNLEFIRLQESDPHFYRHFRYSVLQTLPSNVTSREVIAIETLYKEKLGSRAHGLNLN